ncbi:MAG: hypothetical protein IKV72_03130, partial [Firmicutes bacterium]|nr:hypothetical protein [Bacillota bacterium]
VANAPMEDSAIAEKASPAASSEESALSAAETEEIKSAEIAFAEPQSEEPAETELLVEKPEIAAEEPESPAEEPKPSVAEPKPSVAEPKVSAAEPRIPVRERKISAKKPVYPAEDITDSAFPESTEEDFEDLNFSIAFEDTPHEDPKAKKPVDVSQQQVNELLKKQKSRKQRKTIRQLLSVLSVLLVLILLGCGAFWFYKTQYVKTIDDLTISGTQNQLTVTVKTDTDESLLKVTCTDAYGNSVTQSVVNGQSTFTDLLPDSLYRVELTVDGFHALVGNTAEIFTTDALTSITSISAVTGSEDGSVMVIFTVDGPEPDEWTVTCSADGETDVTQTFTGHNVTVRGLAVGKQYHIQLGASGGAQVLGESSLTFNATQLILAENLTIVSCENGIMTVRWDAPEGATVERWGIRCYNDRGHEEVLEIGGTEFAFTGIDTTVAYTVEVTASGMTEAARITLSANPLNITDLTVNTDTADQLVVDWKYDGAPPEGGWLLLYSLDGFTDHQSVVKCAEPRAVIDNRIPGAQYRFQIQ